MTKSYCAIYQHLGYCYVQPTGLTRVWCYLSTTTPYGDSEAFSWWRWQSVARKPPSHSCSLLRRHPADSCPVQRRTIYRLLQGSALCFFGLKMIPPATTGALCSGRFPDPQGNVHLNTDVDHYFLMGCLHFRIISDEETEIYCWLHSIVQSPNLQSTSKKLTRGRFLQPR
jgi:hypothetical protein